MASRYDRDDERAELRKLINRYQERANKYEYEYQMSGIPSQEKAWMRNQRMADALRDALNGKSDKNELSDLRFSVLLIPVNDAEKCIKAVKSLQSRVREGRA